jgi:hypothetical protein
VSAETNQSLICLKGYQSCPDTLSLLGGKIAESVIVSVSMSVCKTAVKFLTDAQRLSGSKVAPTHESAYPIAAIAFEVKLRKISESKKEPQEKTNERH